MIDCTPENRCPDMIRQMTWSKATRYFVGGSMIGMLLSAIVGMVFQYKGMATQMQISRQIGHLTHSVESMMSEMTYIKRKIRLQDFDTQTTRIYLNKIGKKNGLDPMSIRPFEPPTYEDFKEEKQ